MSGTNVAANVVSVFVSFSSAADNINVRELRAVGGS